ncbi:MAG: hypothetical protein MJZ79_00705 [Paludibacteraceae bacterium]|nr:hypothetical protein [Paludibacteraceae bacterium]
MKRVLFSAALLCASLISFAGVKTETFDDNKWNWTEGADKYKSVSIVDGNMILETNKIEKNVPDLLAQAHSFARIPMRARDNYKLTIHAVMPNGIKTFWVLFFNTGKKCLTIDEEYEDVPSYSLTFFGNYYNLNIGDGQKHSEKLPFKMNGKEFPIEVVITKTRKETKIEINGVQIFKGECELTEPCMGFLVPLKHKLIVSDVSVEQAEEED